VSSRESAIIFDDGTIESKVLQYELKTSYDLQVVNVDAYQPGDLQKWLEKAIEYTEGTLKGILKIILHFPFEDYVQKDIRTQIMELERKHPNIRIIPWYEQAPRQGLQNRAANYGIMEDKFEDITKHTEESLKELWKNEPVIDPDTEMKENVKNIASDIVKESKKTVHEHLDYNLSQASKPRKKRKWNI